MNKQNNQVEEILVAVKAGDAENKFIRCVTKAAFENAGLEIVEEGFYKLTRPDVQVHYAHHFKGSYENARPFYKELEDYAVSGRWYGMVIKGKNASAIARKLVDPKEHVDEMAKEATLREYIPKVLGRKPDMTKNIIHASDSAQNGAAEVARYREMRKRYIKENERGL